MKPFRNLLIRRKLTLIMMLSTSVTLVVACLTWLTYDWTVNRRSLVDELSLVGDVLGHGSADAIQRGSRHDLRQGLLALGGNRDIRQAAIYDADGRILASYRAEHLGDEPAPIVFRTDGYAFSSGALTVFRPILAESGRGDEARLGTLAIQSDLSGIRDHSVKFSGILVPLFGVCLLVSILMSLRLQRLIANPITRLIDAVRAVSASEDLSVRVQKYGDDEVGFLTDSFNEMLQQLEDRAAELADHREMLEDDVQQRTKELREKNEQLRLSMQEAKAAAVAKSQFLANMSHEIRTPMNGILGMNELLLGTPLSEQQRSYADIVRSSAESLLELINQILDFSKIEAGKLRLEEIDFEPFRTVEEVIGLLSSPANKKGLDLVCWIAPNIPSVLSGDPTRFRQVITNLVGNAIKFTEHGRIAVKVEMVQAQADDEEAAMLRILVKDTGIGIPEKKQLTLFRSFSQVDASMTRKYGGTGLGLAISKQLVELMGGRSGSIASWGSGPSSGSRRASAPERKTRSTASSSPKAWCGRASWSPTRALPFARSFTNSSRRGGWSTRSLQMSRGFTRPCVPRPNAAIRSGWSSWTTSSSGT